MLLHESERSSLTPFAHCNFVLILHPRVILASLRISLRQTQRFCVFPLPVQVAALDFSRLGLDGIVLKNEIPLAVPAWYVGVQFVVIRLQAELRTGGVDAEESGKLRLDLLPQELPFVPAVDNEVTLLNRVQFCVVLALLLGLGVRVELTWREFECGVPCQQCCVRGVRSMVE